MIHLRTLILSSDGRAMAPLGQWLHPPEAPAWNRTLSHDGQIATIQSAAVVNLEALGDDTGAWALTVSGREKAPLIGHAETRVWSLDEGGWRPLRLLRVGESLRIPETTALGLIPTWGRVQKVERTELPGRLWPGTPRMWGRPTLARGVWSFATPSCFVHT